MDKLFLLWKVVTLPIVISKAVIQYYTTGTVFSNTNSEFRNSLYQNVHMSVLNHVAPISNSSFSNLRLFHKPISKFINLYRDSPMVKGPSFKHFGEKISDHGYWVTRNEDAKDVIVFIHGGGFFFHLFESQMAGAIALHYALPKDIREKVSIVILDYSLTIFGKTYPTQIWEGLTLHKELANQGYENFHYYGGSCGVNLMLSITRFLAYPEEAHAHFKQFQEFDFNFGPLPQPKSLLMISPWIDPVNAPVLPLRSGTNVEGDLGSRNTVMGDSYLNGLDKEDVRNFLSFRQLNYNEHWSRVDAIREGRAFILEGEREVLRDGVEDFYDKINVNNNIDFYLEKGGIHDAIAYVEGVNYMGRKGASRALNGDFSERYAFTRVANFLSKVIV